GIELCRLVAEQHPDVITILLTGDATVDRAIDAIRAGAYDFIVKPVKLEVLEVAVARALETTRLREELRRLRASAVAADASAIVGSAPELRAMIDLVHRLAPTDVTVLITGESGTGKELVARSLHDLSPRAAEPFVAINCAALPEPLMESELFGHRRGAFTDAKRHRPGLLEQAAAGTVFLDEVSEMSPALQAKLLRALQERSVRAIGSDDERPIRCRILAATNRSLEVEVAHRRFRADLYYRINVVTLKVPPLRTRGNDIISLAQYFLDLIAARARRPRKTLSEGAARVLLDHHWPGNVRELENAMEHAFALSRTSHIVVDDLPKKLRAVVSPVDGVPLDLNALAPLDTVLRRYLYDVLSRVHGNKTRAARILGIDRRSLYRELERNDHPRS
ncbi:MAG: sigma-54-dependent transcriptional regulator, partial [Kofleriaceae bacterium]